MPYTAIRFDKEWPVIRRLDLFRYYFAALAVPSSGARDSASSPPW